tara:strand:- start:204 stop:371 length:168 start_codon:yes stop_codon:yes gene_type:complete
MNKRIVNNYKCILYFIQQTQQFHSSFAGILLAISVKKRGAVSTTPTFQTNEYTNL